MSRPRTKEDDLAAPGRTSVRPPRRFLVVAVLAILAIAAGLVGPTAWATVTGGSTGNTSAGDRIAADPPPPLFPPTQVARTARQVEAQRTAAAGLVRAWVAAHGTKADDKEFVVWIEQVFPAPEASMASSEMPAVVALDKARTPTGVAAATWLETHGKKDIWKLYAHDQRELLDSSTGKQRKTEEKQVLSMSKQVADDLGARFGSSAPYVRKPSLRTDHQVTAGQRCPCSYPSRHAAAAASSRTVLGTLMPSATRSTAPPRRRSTTRGSTWPVTSPPTSGPEHCWGT
jgi:hypothetical protein